MQTELLKITGMTCGGCTSKVTHTLKAIPGVSEVEVSLSAGEATVQYDEQLTSPDQLKSAVKGAGYSVGAAVTAKNLKARVAAAASFAISISEFLSVVLISRRSRAEQTITNKAVRP